MLKESKLGYNWLHQIIFGYYNWILQIFVVLSLVCVCVCVCVCALGFLETTKKCFGTRDYKKLSAACVASVAKEVKGCSRTRSGYS